MSEPVIIGPLPPMWPQYIEGFIDTREVDQFQALLGVLYEKIDTKELSPYTEKEMEEMRSEPYNIKGSSGTCSTKEKGKETS